MKVGEKSAVRKHSACLLSDRTESEVNIGACRVRDSASEYDSDMVGWGKYSMR